MKILVVDDEYVALTKMTTLLSPYGECDAATHARQAFELFKNASESGEPYGLITIDIHLPDIDGIELLKMIRQSERHFGGAIAKKIIISVEGSAHNVTLAARNECDAFLVKPVTRATLADKLASIGVHPSDS